MLVRRPEGWALENADQWSGAMAPGMQEAMKLAQPTEEHKMLATMVGTWEGGVTMWMAPGAEPMSSKGTLHREMAMGGRFLGRPSPVWQRFVPAFCRG